MNTSKTVNEQISAFADSEVPAEQQEHFVKALREPTAREAWDTYHLIGDTLRSSDSAVTLSAGFAGRMAARLAAEPSFLGNATAVNNPAHVGSVIQAPSVPQRALRRLALPGAAMAATVLLAVAVGPRLHGNHPESVASAARPAAVVAVSAGMRDDQTVLRNPQIDEYLVAHQRFSPSLYSTAQYARPSTFATESNK